MRPQRTAIIDIGSNSARLVVFEKTSRYGFHLICEQKAKVRIGEGAYNKNGYLQPVGIKRAFLALQSFVNTIEKYQAGETICVATSALRDAPNGREFVHWIQSELHLTIQVIDGKKEAWYGALAASNLLPVKDGITIDIGGGSSDMALIRNGDILETFSLNLGTVRLKELFFDTHLTLEESNLQAQNFIQKELQMLPASFQHAIAIGIGGTARTLSKGIMKLSDYPLEKLHAFTYELEKHQTFLNAIPKSSAKGLKKFNLKKNRYDTIREGTLIWNEIVSHIGAEIVITSAVGVREGVFLEQSLKEDGFKFPQEINPSVNSILDRFKPTIHLEKKRDFKFKIASELYHALQEEIHHGLQYLPELICALKLSSIGKTLTIYRSNQHAFYIAMQELNYGFTHQQILLISLLLRVHGKELLYKPLFTNYNLLLPEKEELSWLSFIFSLTLYIKEASNDATITFSYREQVLTITSDQPLYLTKEKIKSLEKPKPFAIIIKDTPIIPENRALGI